MLDKITEFCQIQKKTFVWPLRVGSNLKAISRSTKILSRLTLDEDHSDSAGT